VSGEEIGDNDQVRLALPILLALAGCGFQVSGGQPIMGDDQPSGDDAAPPDVMTPDGPPDADIDAPCADEDSDGVCNEDDVCAEGNDHDDEDHDTVPDHCDDWPCGVRPAPVGSPVAWNNAGTYHGQDATERTMLSNTKLGGTSSNLYVVAPNTQISLVSDYSIYDCICPTCIDQVQVGFATNATYSEHPKCLFSGTLNTNCTVPKTGTTTVSIKAPAQPGVVYDVVFGRAQATSCGGDWWPGMPAPNSTVAKVCVH
jgi:hypothetical protein